MLSVQQLTKSYGDRKVVDNLSFTLRAGEVVGLLGPNGAGKTTTMNMLTGFLAPTSGAVFVDGVDIRRNPQAGARYLGFLPDTPPLYNEMTVRSYLEFVYRLKGVQDVNRQKHIAEVCHNADINDVLPRIVGHLSRGYRQRVGLAAALIGDPDVLILDEPTIGLDPKQIKDIRQLIATLGESRAVLISTHILPEVSALCSRVLVLHHGVIVADAAPAALRKPQDGELCQIRIADGQGTPALKTLAKMRGVVECHTQTAEELGYIDVLVTCSEDIRPQLLQALAAAEVSVFALTRSQQGLEDIFLSLTLEEADVTPEVRGRKK